MNINEAMADLRSSGRRAIGRPLRGTSSSDDLQGMAGCPPTGTYPAGWDHDLSDTDCWQANASGTGLKVISGTR